jgi:hypothetical protein
VSTSRFVSLIYYVNFLLLLSQARWVEAAGWLLMSAGFLLMDRVPPALYAMPFTDRFVNRNWRLGHLSLSTAVILLFLGLVSRRLFA